MLKTGFKLTVRLIIILITGNHDTGKGNNCSSAGVERRKVIGEAVNVCNRMIVVVSSNDKRPAKLGRKAWAFIRRGRGHGADIQQTKYTRRERLGFRLESTIP